MLYPETLDDHNSGEQESRALLPATRSKAQQHVGNAAKRTGAHVPGQQDDLSALNDREVWRHFESTKRSAIFYLDEYLYYREVVRQDAGLAESLSLDLVLQSQAEAPRSFWDFKAARDNLLNELDLLNSLLEYMCSKLKKGLATFYSIILILVVVVKLLEYGKSTGAKVAWGILITVLGTSAGYTAYRTAWFGSIN